MTIAEAAKKKITKLRMPNWHDRAYLEITLVGEDGYGCWGKLVDPAGEPMGLGEQQVLLIGEISQVDTYEEFTE